MDIIATCEHCEREVPLGDVVNDPGITGRCPWCGASLAPDNIGLLVDTVRKAEAAGYELVRAVRILVGRLDSFSDSAPDRALPDHGVSASHSSMRLALRRESSVRLHDTLSTYRRR